MFSPAIQNISSNCNKTPPPSPLPLDIQRSWAPSSVSTPRKPEIFTPDFQPHSPSNFNCQIPLMPQNEPLKVKKNAQVKYKEFKVNIRECKKKHIN